MKYFFFFLAYITILSPVCASSSTDELVDQMARDFIEKNREKIKDMGSWKVCFKKCMINDCMDCDGDGYCEDPPCESADDCSTCPGQCQVYPDRTGAFCSTVCFFRCL